MKRFQIDVEYSEVKYPTGSIIIETYPIEGKEKKYELPMGYDEFLKVTGISSSKKSGTLYDNKASTFLKNNKIKDLIKKYYKEGTDTRYIRRFEEADTKRISEILPDIKVNIEISFYGPTDKIKAKFDKVIKLVDPNDESKPSTVKGSITIGNLESIKDFNVKNIKNV